MDANKLLAFIKNTSHKKVCGGVTIKHKNIVQKTIAKEFI